MSKRILAVEDQPDNRQIIRDMLAPTDYEITEAENGEEELAAIASQRPDLILMDIQLPIMDGYTARAGLKPILVTAMMGIDRKALPMRSAGRRRRPGRPGGPSAHALADDISETKPRPKSPNRTTMAVEAENRTPRVPRSSKKLLSGNQIHPSRLLPWMGSKRILVVEDQPDNRQIIRDMLALPTTKLQRPKTASRRWRQSQSSRQISF
jgi:CheY-like chemotaxis protein